MWPSGGDPWACARRGDEEAMQELVKRNDANKWLNEEDDSIFGRTPLAYACFHGHLGVARCLLSSGADVNCTDEDGFTPLHGASIYGHFEVVKCLLVRGACVDAVDGGAGISPIGWAVNKGHSSVVELFIQEELNGRLFYKERGSLFHVACKGYVHMELLKLLFDRGLDATKKDQHGKLPVDYVVDAEMKAEVMRLLAPAAEKTGQGGARRQCEQEEAGLGEERERENRLRVQEETIQHLKAEVKEMLQKKEEEHAKHQQELGEKEDYLRRQRETIHHLKADVKEVLRREEEAAARRRSEQEERSRVEKEQERVAREHEEEVHHLKAKLEEVEARRQSEQEERSRVEKEQLNRLKQHEEEVLHLKADMKDMLLREEEAAVRRQRDEEEHERVAREHEEEIDRLKAELEEVEARRKSEQEERSRVEKEQLNRLRQHEEEIDRLKAELDGARRQPDEDTIKDDNSDNGDNSNDSDGMGKKQEDGDRSSGVNQSPQVDVPFMERIIGVHDNGDNFSIGLSSLPLTPTAEQQPLPLSSSPQVETAVPDAGAPQGPPSHQQASPATRKVQIDDVTLGERIGQGAFGEVFKGYCHHQDVAVKVFECGPQRVARKIQREVEIMCQLSHPNIVSLYGLVEREGGPMLVMEFGARGSLFDFLRNAEVPWPQRLRISFELSLGLAYLHLMGVVHRDIKSLNVIMDGDFHAKWCDFGLASAKSHLSTSATAAKSHGAGSQDRHRPIGTLRWLAPEQFLSKSRSPSRASDVWSLGMVFFELASLKVPFWESSNDVVIAVWIQQGEGEEIPEECDEVLAGIMRRCWLKPSKRPHADTIAEELRALLSERMDR